MAKAPPLEALAAQYGPHLNYTPAGGWQGESGRGPETLVKTHRCFCGQQCGIQLKVRENRKLCTACKRKTFAVAPMRIKENARG